MAEIGLCESAGPDEVLPAYVRPTRELSGDAAFGSGRFFDDDPQMCARPHAKARDLAGYRWAGQRR
jgi:hypothetical protein